MRFRTGAAALAILSIALALPATGTAAQTPPQDHATPQAIAVTPHPVTMAVVPSVADLGALSLDSMYVLARPADVVQALRSMWWTRPGNRIDTSPVEATRWRLTTNRTPTSRLGTRAFPLRE